MRGLWSLTWAVFLALAGATAFILIVELWRYGGEVAVPASSTHCDKQCAMNASKRCELSADSLKRLDTILCLKGRITPEMAELAREEAFSDWTTLVVSSPGGHSLAALDIAEAFAAKDHTIVVVGRCLSACAQFLFLAAPKKIVLDDAILKFHNGVGTSRNRELWRMMKGVPDDLFSDAETLQRRQELFYPRYGVDPAIVNCIPLNQAERDKYLWSWSRKELEGFGVKGIEYYKGE